MEQLVYDYSQEIEEYDNDEFESLTQMENRISVFEKKTMDTIDDLYLNFRI